MAILINIYVIIIFLCPEFEVHINKLLGTIFDIGINEALKNVNRYNSKRKYNKAIHSTVKKNRKTLILLISNFKIILL